VSLLKQIVESTRVFAFQFRDDISWRAGTIREGTNSKQSS